MKQPSKNSNLANLFRAMLLLALIGTVHAAPLLIEQIPDPEEAPSAAELIALEQKAEEGDWRIKQQFAAAYLYEHLALPEWNHGCKELKHGHYCRALAARVESGQRFLYQIVELPIDGPIAPRQLAVFQRDLPTVGNLLPGHNMTLRIMPARKLLGTLRERLKTS